MSGLYLDLSPGDAVRIGEDAYITVEKKSGRVARLRFVGLEDVELLRARRPRATTLPNPPAVDTGD